MFSPEMNPGLGRSGRVLPKLETLEDRCCPTTVALNAHTHLLTLTGGAAASTVVVLDDGHGDIQVSGLAGATAAHPLKYTGVTGISINSTTGNDVIDYALTGPLTKSEQLTLNLGKGDDQVKLDFTKGVSAPSLNINVNGGLANQDVTALFGSITNTDLQLAARLGNGLEHFTADFNGALAGNANVGVNVQGGTLSDSINVQANAAIAATAKLSVTTTVDGESDTVHVGYAGKLAGGLSIQEKAGGGWDWQEADINLASGSTGSLFAHEQGGAGADLLILTVQDVGSRLRSLSATINTGVGRHAVVSTSNVHVSA